MPTVTALLTLKLTTCTGKLCRKAHLEKISSKYYLSSWHYEAPPSFYAVRTAVACIFSYINFTVCI